jgi:hypothetical protein
MASNTPDGPKPIVLHARQDINAKVDLDARVCAIACAHPDGLLGVYEVLIPFHQIKRIAGVIANKEGMHELAVIRKQQSEQRIRIVE